VIRNIRRWDPGKVETVLILTSVIDLFITIYNLLAPCRSVTLATCRRNFCRRMWFCNMPTMILLYVQSWYVNRWRLVLYFTF